MTRDEADRIHDVLLGIQGINVIFDLATNKMEITAKGPNTYCMRSFHVDPPQLVTYTPPVVAGVYRVITNGGPQTISVPAGGSISLTIPQADPKDLKWEIVGRDVAAKCTCGADKVQGLHSSWCDKK